MFRQFNVKFTNVLIMIVIIFSSMLSGYLFINSIRISVDAPLEYGFTISRYIIADNVIKHLLIVILFLLCTAVFLYVVKKNSNKEKLIECIVLIASAVLFWSAVIIYLINSKYYPSGDQIMVSAAPHYFWEGNYGFFSKGGYLMFYRFQEGLVFLYELFFRIFGDMNYLAVKIANSFFLYSIIASAWCLLKMNKASVVSRCLCVVLLTGCAPLIMLIPYVYGDIPSIALSLISIVLLVLFEKKKKIYLVCLSAFLMSIAILCRGNSWIIVIAICISVVIYAIRHKKYIAICCCALYVAIPIILSSSIHSMYTARSGYDFPQTPKILWVAMGMQETDGIPGKYNDYQRTVFSLNEFDADKAAEEGKKYISDRIKDFKKDKKLAKDFYQRKIETQWFEPTFESFRNVYSFSPAMFLPEGEELDEINQSFYHGKLHLVIWKYANYYQSIVYFLFFAFLVIQTVSFFKNEGAKKKLKVSGSLILLLAIIGGFLFSIIWENQCRYQLPYYVFIIICASCTYNMINPQKGKK